MICKCEAKIRSADGLCTLCGGYIEPAAASNGYNFVDNETTRENAYYAVAHALAGIDDADMTVCQNVVDSLFDAIKSVSTKL